MHNRPRIVHLIDDTTAGGVMRVLEHIKTSPDMAEIADHQFVQVQRGRVSGRHYDCDVIVSHLAVSWRSLPMFLALKLANSGAKLAHVEHSYTAGFVAHNVPNKTRFHALLKTTFAIFDAVVAVSDGQAEWIRREKLCDAAKLSVIRSCVDLSAFQNAQPVSNRPRVFGAIGRLDRQKGFDTLIKAFRAISDPSVQLRIFGEGEEYEYLASLAADDPRIHFDGFATNPVQAYEAVDVVIIPSRWEAYGLVAIEALVAGRTALCASVDGLRDHMEYGGQPLDTASVSALTKAMEDVLATDVTKPQSANSDLEHQLQNSFVTGWARFLDTVTGVQGIEPRTGLSVKT
ncbi:glycosyltransferase [Tateyamaria pelophila]|uniref:glycosyltransferase n=1 Tax=Tateyamaria pelophila TaxID=328415 RepID=UPI001CBCF7F1|nr:glycosyltransferase [Tateyamaria pelophila]